MEHKDSDDDDEDAEVDQGSPSAVVHTFWACRRRSLRRCSPASVIQLGVHIHPLPQDVERDPGEQARRRLDGHLRPLRDEIYAGCWMFSSENTSLPLCVSSRYISWMTPKRGPRMA